MYARHVLIATALLGAAAQPSACELSMALEQWPPYVYSNASGAVTGLDWELLQAIFKQAGCKLKLQPELPTARRQHLFEQGQLDLLLAASDTPERRRHARFSLAYRFENVGVFTRTSLLERYRHVNSLDILLNEKLALLAPKVGWYGPAYARVQPSLLVSGKLSPFISFQQGVRMLDAGRADLILGDRAALRHAARVQGVAISPLPLVVLRAPVHLMLNKDTTTQQDLDRINAAISLLENQGVLAKIRSRYGNS
jgi:polar amino acid transport system substrate-binding protein